MESDPVPSDPFKVLGLEPSFDIDSSRLRAVWLRRAAQEHPDASGSMGASADLNSAYKVLSEPVSRAEALLGLRSAPEVDPKRLPDGFLLVMMELRERADDARGDSAALAALRAEAEEGRRAALAAISQAFRDCALPRMSCEAAQLVRIQINVLRSFERMLEQLDREAGGS